jgi:hypothetical protein
MVSTICSLYSIQTGGITIACDNILAFQNSFEDHKLPRLSKVDHDLLYAIKNKLSCLPNAFHHLHIKGHQDDKIPEGDLDRWSLLIIEMDALAKSAMQHWSETQSCQEIEGKPWSIWANGWKLIKNLNSKLYEVVHIDQLENYWVQKEIFLFTKQITCPILKKGP